MPEQMQARFWIQHLDKFPTHAVLHMYPVSGARGDANKSWSSATPSGSIEMTITNMDAVAFLDKHIGEDFAITFEPRPKEETDA